MSLTALIFTLVFTSGILLAIFRDPIYGLYTYMAVFYLDAPHRWWGADLPDIRWSMLVAVVTLISILVRKKKTLRPGILTYKPILLFAIYVIWMWLQFPWAISYEDHAYGATLFAKYLVVIFLIYSLIDRKQRLIDFLFVHTMGCFYLGILAYSVKSGGRLDGVGGPGIDDASSLGMQLATGAIAGVSVFLAERKLRRWIVVLALPFILNAIVLTGSRGAFLALFLGGATFLLFRPRRQIKLVIAFSVLGLGLFGYLANDVFWNRMSSITNVVEDNANVDRSVETRLILFKKQLQMVGKYPFGAGHKGTAALSYQYIDEEHMSSTGGRSSHNTIMSSLVDQGIPGLIIWLWIIVVLVRVAFANRKWCRKNSRDTDCWLNAGIVGGLAVIVIAGMFSPQIKAESYIWYLSALCALNSFTVEGSEQSDQFDIKLAARPYEAAS